MTTKRLLLMLLFAHICTCALAVGLVREIKDPFGFSELTSGELAKLRRIVWNIFNYIIETVKLILIGLPATASYYYK